MIQQSDKDVIYTIGHSTHAIADFIEMLQSFRIKTLVDIRSLPGSRKFPHFDKENLERILPENGIQYLHLSDLGGRRKRKKDSKNDRWNNESFRGYADYMETPEFDAAVTQLKALALKQPTTMMCAEAVWWRCHRSMISDYLKVKGWDVLHIMAVDKSKAHRYTSPALIIEGNLTYSNIGT